MKRRFLAVISVLVLISMMSLSVCAKSPTSGDLEQHSDEQPVSNDNSGIQTYADVDDESTISEQLIAADVDTEELPSVSGDMFIAPDTGDKVNTCSYILLVGLTGAIVLTYKKIKKA